MKKYEVTLPLKPGPWYTGYAMADSKDQAISMITNKARSQGFKGRITGRAEVLEVK